MVSATRDAMRLGGFSAADVWREAHEIRGRWTKKERLCRAFEAQRLQQKLWHSLWGCDEPSANHRGMRQVAARRQS
jgi:hypothetical protein